MRVLLDECVNPRVKEAFPSHEVQTVKSMGWTGVTNGKLIALAQERFDVFDNKTEYFRPIFSQLLKAVESINPGQVIHIISPKIH